MEFVKQKGPGLLLCLAIAVPCWLLGKAFPVIGGPVFAILAGMVLTLLLKNKALFQGGVTYTSSPCPSSAPPSPPPWWSPSCCTSC